MKTKRVNRYYCDFCGKGGCGCAAMKNHEEHCTMNPSRICRLCKLAELNGNDLVAMIKLVKTATNQNVESVLTELGDMADQCPVCMLAAIRQSGNQDIFYDGVFDYKKASDGFMHELDERRREQAERETYD